MPIQLNPISLLINREIALRQNVDPSRAVPLALAGSLLGGTTSSPLVGPLLTRHLAQREAIPIPASTTTIPSEGVFVGPGESSELADISRAQEELQRKIDEAKEGVRIAQEAVTAATAALEAAKKAQTDVTHDAIEQAEELKSKIEESKKLQDQSFDQAIASANDYLSKLSDSSAASATGATQPLPAGSATIAKSAHRSHRGSKATVNPGSHR